MSESVYVLMSRNRNKDSDDGATVRGIHTSMNSLQKAVEHWMKIRPVETMWFEEWEIDALYPDEWDWCYIPTTSNVQDLASGGGYVPQKKYWGINLVNIEWKRIPNEEMEQGVN